MSLLSYLQTFHHLSRRKSVALIKQGLIFVNKQQVVSYTHSLVPGDEVTLSNGTEVQHYIFSPCATENAPMLLLFNKPKGYVVSMSDPHNPTVYELLPEEFHQYYYIGRLDKESRGLLLFTNTSALVHRYEHPRFALEKEYVIQLSSPLSKQALEQAKRGLQVQDDHGKFERLAFEKIVPTSIPCQYKVLLYAGKKRHIRRVIKALGYELLDLQRIREGEWQLGNLKERERKVVRIRDYVHHKK